MSVERIEFAVGRQRFSDEQAALQAATAPTEVYRLHWGRRGIRCVEVRTMSGAWRRVQSAPGGQSQ